LRFAERTGRIPQYEAALAAARRQGDIEATGPLLSNLGAAYANLRETRRAIAFYEQALGISREIGDQQGEGSALHNLGAAYETLGELEQAVSYVEEAYALFIQIESPYAEQAQRLALQLRQRLNSGSDDELPPA